MLFCPSLSFSDYNTGSHFFFTQEASGSRLAGAGPPLLLWLVDVDLVDLKKIKTVSLGPGPLDLLYISVPEDMGTEVNAAVAHSVCSRDTVDGRTSGT